MYDLCEIDRSTWKGITVTSLFQYENLLAVEFEIRQTVVFYRVKTNLTQTNLMFPRRMELNIRPTLLNQLKVHPGRCDIGEVTITI